MGIEIERKFLVTGDVYKQQNPGEVYRQGYLNSEKERVVRVRTLSDKGFITIKGITQGATRLEYEYEIDLKEANEMLDQLCIHPIIEKVRYRVEIDHLVWEVDEFHAENEGLVVAEIELESEEQEVVKPDWIGKEVTRESRYYNSNLITNPFKDWKK